VDFRGHLRLPDDAGSGIPVVLRLDDIFVIIVSGGEELGAWRADDVVVERIFSNQFAIDLAGEPMVFIAQDALGFAYEGVSAIEELQARLTKRKVFKRSKKRKGKQAEEPQPAAEATAPAAAAASHRPVLEPDEPVDPQPGRIWTPPVSRPTSGVPLEPDAAPEPTATEHVEEPAARIEHERVSYAQPGAGEDAGTPAVTAAPPPAPEPPASGPEEIPTRPRDDTPVETAVEPAATKPEPEPVPEVEIAPAPEPAPQPEPEVQIEIEEVEAASGGWYSEETATDTRHSVPDAEPEPGEVSQPDVRFEFEIEDVEPSAAGGIDTYRPSAPAEEAPAAVPAPIEAEIQAAPPEPDAEPAAFASPEEQTVETPEEQTVEPPEERVEDEVPAAANGHGRTRHLAKPEKRSLRPAFLSRSKDKKIPEHDHEYGEPKTIGGLTRRVCEICGHVTFSGEDVYHGW
jgi:hypothetical protein